MVDRDQGVGDGAPGVVMEVNAEFDIDLIPDLGEDRPQLGRQGASIGVTKHDGSCTARGTSFEHSEGKGRVIFEAIEKMLGIEEDPALMLDKEGDRLAHHCQCLLERGPERMHHMVVPGLGHDADIVDTTLDQGLQVWIASNVGISPTGRAKGNESCGMQVELGCCTREEGGILGVGTRPAALNVVHPEAVELTSNPELVINGKGDSLLL